MERVPIADRTDAQKASLSELVEQILADPESDCVREIEQQIDALVYQLYGLTDQGYLVLWILVVFYHNR